MLRLLVPSLNLPIRATSIAPHKPVSLSACMAVKSRPTLQPPAPSPTVIPQLCCYNIVDLCGITIEGFFYRLLSLIKVAGWVVRHKCLLVLSVWDKEVHSCLCFAGTFDFCVSVCLCTVYGQHIFFIHPFPFCEHLNRLCGEHPLLLFHTDNFLGDCGAAAGWLRVNPSAACAVCAALRPQLRWRSYSARRLPSPYLDRNLPAFSVAPQVPGTKWLL